MISSEEGAALRQLFDELTVAQQRTGAAYQAGRPDDEAASDQQVAEIIRRVKAITGQ